MAVPILGRLPVWLNAQVSISLRTSTLLILLAIIGAVFSSLVRRRVTTRYSRLPKELDNEEEDESAILSEMWDVPSDSDSEDAELQNSSPTSQLDDFLKAIKVFGYLDSDVFNELTKSTKTLRVNVGERVNLKELDGFTVVISGAMSVYCHSETSSNGLDLLNEIKRPAPISSLSSILSLLSETGDESTNTFEKVNATICAVAAEPSTIVVIPAEAFRNMKWKFPVATANIVQIILFRWSQITFRTCQRYLNLTQQFYETERLLNDPNWNKSYRAVPDEIARSMVKQIRTQLAHSGSDESIFQLSSTHLPSLSRGMLDGEASMSRGRSKSGFSDVMRRSITPGIKSLEQDHPELSSPDSTSLRKARVQEEFRMRCEIVESIVSIMGLEISKFEQRQEPKKQAASQPGLYIGRKPNEMSPQDIINHMSEKLELFWYREGEYVAHYNERSSGIIYVLEGTLNVQNQGQLLYEVKSGSVTGFLETIASNTAFVDLIAKEDTFVAIIPKSCFEFVVEMDPILYLSAAKTLTNNLSRPIVQLDFALEWISVRSGDRVIRQGSSADAIYFVLNGRLRAYQNKKVIGEYGHGSSIGELETMSGGKYKYTTVAVRDTELSRFPRSLIPILARQYPNIAFEMSRMVVQSMEAQVPVEQSQFQNIKAIAVLPVMSGVPIDEFASKLKTAFQMNGKTVKVLTNTAILQYLGKYAFHKMGSLKLKAYLGELEDRFDIILYVGDGNSNSSWTRTCISETYMILLVADGSAAPTFGEVERLVIKSPNRSMAHLILLHREKQVKHGSTAKWLKHRPWISRHHHIEMDFEPEDDHAMTFQQPNRVQKKLRQIKSRVQDEIKLLNQSKLLRRYTDISPGGTASLPYKNDFSRLARILSGEAVGLVLGGGGARGLSHIGVVQALEEAGVPIDMVGGTSIGSLIGGLYAKDYDFVPLLRKSKQFSARVSEFWRLLWDITYPMTAWTTGHEFNRAVWKALGDSRIEDFWLQYFTNTTNLSLSTMDVHHRGYSWRYIRASMSLAGLLPPIEEKGNMLLDGGYVDNLPVTEMKKLGARYVLAVDVGAVDDTTHLNYGDTLSGFWGLVNKYNPFSNEPNPPNIAEIQQRLTYVSSVKALEEAKSMKDVLYLRPPIDNYATLDFGRFDEIREVGFKYGTEKLHEIIEQGELPTHNRKAASSKQFHYRRYSF